MSSKQIRNTAKLLLFLYLGYFGCVSYFVHSHIYNGVVYVHSHPYNKFAKNADDDKLPPFETHHHTSAGFFTFNQLSNTTSFEADCINTLDGVDFYVDILQYKELAPQVISCPVAVYFNYRAPPTSSFS
ncbi:hypothetical protein JGH11_01280 [Dysgonomonas sp. Marseille-P4677]|uniref:hypothetical protein n=1 Tax=Dysgonomonas sp. Marseille-P4677 TaxID=2364790 RepID=UPI001913787F|nr:hypothetical protein [Dysgonomonas sp. Marseille-P4677]MBK5719494.1 hypothetical protein [Dysgonomonas sp. Marseille-P4677]